MDGADFYPTARAGDFSGARTWRRRGEWWPTGRRRIPIAQVSRLWMEGLTARQIAIALGEMKGTRFTAGAIRTAIYHERHFGNPALFPSRRSADDGEFDPGIDEHMARALGL